MRQLLIIIVLALSMTGRTQSIITWVDTMAKCPGNQVTVPVKVKNFHNIYSISLTLQYDQTALSFVQFQNTNPVLLGCALNNVTTFNPYQIRAAWYSTGTEASLPDSATLFEIVFNYNTNYSNLTWFPSTGYCLYTDVDGNYLPSTFKDGLIYKTKLDGFVRYDNFAQSPVSNVKVYAWLNNIAIDSVITDVLGHFVFGCLPTGVINFSSVKTGGWGGGNSIDALMVAKYSVGAISLSPFRAIAANVNNNSSINAGDAFLIAKRFVGIITSFPAPDWFFEPPPPAVIGPNQTTIYIKAICAGDVDGSFTP